MVSKIRQKLRSELEAPAAHRRFGTGWISGVIALMGSIAALGAMICVVLPGVFTTPQLHELYQHVPYRLVIHAVLIGSFFMAVISIVLRGTKTLGFCAVFLIMMASLLGMVQTHIDAAATHGVFFGLDWFLLNVLLTGIIFLPLEHLFPKNAEKPLFRDEWREDMFYYFISSLFVQVLSFLSLLPARQVGAHLGFAEFRAMVGAQPLILQFFEIMLLTDLVQYWVHRAFHRVPALWHFHAVHHSAKTLDWLAGARMHFVEILFLRGLTIIPMMTLGFQDIAVQAYIVTVYAYATFIHTNTRWSPRALDSILVTPRFHHWHHGIEKKAIDVNFAIHFPILDRLFGTYYVPGDKWPEGYGVGGHPVPQGYLKQFMYPFRRKDC